MCWEETYPKAANIRGGARRCFWRGEAKSRPLRRHPLPELLENVSQTAQDYFARPQKAEAPQGTWASAAAADLLYEAAASPKPGLVDTAGNARSPT
jgi:hypothetical protein